MTENEKIEWKRTSCDEDFHTGNPERWRRCPNCDAAEVFYMTENEKAATFIGWRPGEVCESEMGCPEWDMDQSSVFHRDHLIAAPDMSDPRNYTKALDNVRVAGVYYPEILTNNIGWLMRFGKVLGPPDEDGTPFTLARIANSNPNFGVAATKALARLYDAEHP